ncbi:MAG: hypothetical protein KZY61_05105 [Clostridiaceae bacterium]|nr:hypothetical protein [Clostridiaceae bacterium]MBW4858522.1 hypothetical protein [Clostridiaceae bacterium]MBW4867770.1 hypothetical protein [Clostridiaceae bacterium]MBW4868040.1 hypothetical protein [Clostridiaceae bacterium]
MGKVDKVVSKVRNIGKLEVKMVEAISIDKAISIDRNETYYGDLMV